MSDLVIDGSDGFLTTQGFALASRESKVIGSTCVVWGGAGPESTSPCAATQQLGNLGKSCALSCLSFSICKSRRWGQGISTRPPSSGKSVLLGQECLEAHVLCQGTGPSRARDQNWPPRGGRKQAAHFYRCSSSCLPPPPSSDIAFYARVYHLSLSSSVPVQFLKLQIGEP